MSEMERNVGTLKLVPSVGKTLEEQAEAILSSKLCVKPSDFRCDTWLEFMDGEFYKEYYIDFSNKKIYELSYETRDEEFDHYLAHTEPDGTIKFDVNYYNGGCCLYEAIDEAMKNLDK